MREGREGMSRVTRLLDIGEEAQGIVRRLVAERHASPDGLTTYEFDMAVDTLAWLLSQGLVYCPKLDILPHLPKTPERFSPSMRWHPTQKAIDLVEAYERSVWPELVDPDNEDESVPMWDYWLDKKGMSGALEQVEGDPRVKKNERLQQAIALYRTAETAIDALMREIGV